MCRPIAAQISKTTLLQIMLLYSPDLKKYPFHAGLRGYTYEVICDHVTVKMVIQAVKNSGIVLANDRVRNGVNLHKYCAFVAL